MVRSSLDYSAETGSLKWKVRTAQEFTDSPKKSAEAKAKAFNKVFAGKDFGAPSSHGYIQGSIHGKVYYGHQICWFLSYGEWPQGVIDHINGIGTDNRLSNLRHTTQEQNCRNSRARGNGNMTGIRMEPSGRWSARINFKSREYHMGLFETRDAAIKARLDEARRRGFTERHGG